MQRRLRLLILLIVPGIFAWPAWAAKDQDSDKDKIRDLTHPGYSIKQSSQLIGDVSIILSARGVKVTSLKHSLSMLCVAPFTEVVLFSERTRKFHVTPFNTFACPVTRTLTVMNNGLMAETPISRKADTTYQGLKVHTFESTPQFTQGQLARYKAGELPGRSVRSLKSYSTEDFKQDPHIGLALERFFGLPKMPGVPVFLEYIDLGNDRNCNLKTFHAQASMVKDASFTIPPSFKKASKHEELFVGEDTADEVKIMMMGDR